MNSTTYCTKCRLTLILLTDWSKTVGIIVLHRQIKLDEAVDFPNNVFMVELTVTIRLAAQNPITSK